MELLAIQLPPKRHQSIPFYKDTPLNARLHKSKPQNFVFVVAGLTGGGYENHNPYVAPCLSAP